MTTGATNFIFTSTRLASSSDFKDRLQTPLRQADRDRMSKVYPDDGVFTTKLGISGAVDLFSITGTSESTDGLGEVLDHTLATDDGSSVPFENLAATNYFVALTFTERPIGIQINPKNGKPEYIELLEDVGDRGDPDSVVDNGANLTFNINSLVESGVDFSGRTCVVYMKVPDQGATSEAVAIETVIVAFSTPNNTITTTGLLGQSSPASTTAADYEVVVLGPTVRKNTDLRTVSGIVFIGIVTGGGAGFVPSALDTSDQRLIDVTLSGINDVLDNFVRPQIVTAARAGDKAPITTAREGAHSVLYTDNLIYVMGGDTDPTTAGFTLSAANEAYNASTNTWTTKTVIPSQAGGGPAIGARKHARAAFVGDTIYLVGGSDGVISYELTQGFKPGTNTWDASAKADLPAPRAGGAIGAINGKIYYAGGHTGAIATGHDNTYEYDPVLDSWTEVASISTAVAIAGTFPAFAVVDNKLYLFGGFQPAASNHSFVVVYDPALDTWTRLNDLPEHPAIGSSNRTDAVAVSVNGVIHIFGGLVGLSKFTKHHYMYNRVSDTYMHYDDMRTQGRSEFTASQDELGNIFIFSGTIETGPPDAPVDTRILTNAVAGFDATKIFRADNDGISSITGKTNIRENTSGFVGTSPNGTTLRSMFNNVVGGKAVTFEGRIYIHGGEETGLTDTTMLYDPETNTYTYLAQSGLAIRGHGWEVHEGLRKIFRFLGEDGVGPPSDTIQAYNPDSDIWDAAEPGVFTLGVSDAAYGIYGGMLLSSGGQNGGPVTTQQSYDFLVTGAGTIGVALSLARSNVGGGIVRALNGERPVMVIAGGDAAGPVATHDDVQIWDINDDSIAVSTLLLPDDRNMMGSVVVEDETGRQLLVLIGGENDTPVFLAPIVIIDINAGTITNSISLALAPQAGERDYPIVAQVDGRIYVFGGDDSVGGRKDLEITDEFSSNIKPLIENFTNSFRQVVSFTTRPATRVPHREHTVGFQENEIWGYGTWDVQAKSDIIQIGEK